MTIKKKTLLWFLIPSILIATATTTFCYFYTRSTIEQNIFNQLELAADELHESVHVFLNGKKSRIADFGSDGFIRDSIEEITMKENRIAYHTSALSTHLTTNKKSLDPSILGVSIVDLKGKIIASADENRIGEDVSGKEYFSETASSNVYNSEPYYDTRLKEIVIDFSAVLLSKIEREPIGIIVNQIRYEQKEDKGLNSALIPQDEELDYSLLIAVNKARIMDFSSDGFIRDSTVEITRRDKRVLYYTDLLNEYLDDSKEPLDNDILTAFIVDLDGNVISSTDIDQIGENISNKAYFLKTIRRGSSISDLHYYPNYEQNTFEVARLLLSNERQDSIGIIVHRYNGDNLRKITRSGIMGRLDNVEQLEGLGETGEMYIVNNKKLMITESRFIEDAILEQVVDTEGVNAALDYKVGMTGIYNNYRGIPVLGVSMYIEDMDWVVLAEKDVSEAFAPLSRLRNFVIIMGVTGIMVIVIVAVLFARGITRPIKKLMEGTRRIATGDLKHPITVDKENDEMKELGESFNLMMKGLGESTRENKQLFMQVKRGRDEWVKTFDAITDIITIHDKDFRILRANKTFFEKFGVNKRQFHGKRCYEIFHDIDTPWHSCPLDKSIKSLRPEIEEVVDPHMGGSFLISVYPLKNERGETYGFVHLAKDITLQKQIEKEIKDLAKFPSENPNPILRIAKNGKILFSNNAGSIFLELWGSQIGQPLPESWHKTILDVLSSGTSKYSEIVCVDRVFSLTFAPVVEENYVNVYALDITKMKKVESEIIKEKEYTEDLIETAHDAIVCVDEKGTINVWNKSAEIIFGYAKSEILGKSISTIIPEDILDSFLQVSKIITISRVIEVSGKTKDGIIIPIEMSISSREIEKGRYTFTIIMRDITFQKEAKKQLVEKANELRKANKELEDFVYIVSHDLKEPLFAIGGYTSRLFRLYEDTFDDKGKQYIDRIKVNVERMSQKIQEIMEVLKVGRVAYDFKNNDSGAIVTDVVNTLESKMKAERIKVSIEDNLPTVLCDEKRMKDVFSNLVTNAIKFMGNDKPPVSPLKVPFAKSPMNPPNSPFIKGGQRGIIIGCHKNGDYYKFYVEDTGIGIREEYREQIFKIFRRLKDVETEGTGAGLAIVKKIVELHKGKIWAESPAGNGRGTRFCFTIPKDKRIPDHPNLDKPEPNRS